MQPDPVVVLLQNLRSADRLLEEALRSRDDTAVDRQLTAIKQLHLQLHQCAATTTEGAAILLSEAACALLRTFPAQAGHLSRVSSRLSRGERSLADLVWLRGLANSLEKEPCGTAERKAAPLIALALRGACRPKSVALGPPALRGSNPASTIAAGG